MVRQIIQEEFPLWDPPKFRHLMIVEANHERRNDIEFLSQPRERMKRLDSLNDAANAKQARNFPEHWQVVDVEANSGMTEQLRDVEKVPCAAAQIENPLGTRQVEFELANPSDVNSDPAIEIEIFRPVPAGIRDRVSPANLFELDWIDCLNDALCLQRKAVRAQQPEGTFPRAGQTLTVDQFSYFMAKLHSSHLVAKCKNFN